MTPDSPEGPLPPERQPRRPDGPQRTPSPGPGASPPRSDPPRPSREDAHREDDFVPPAKSVRPKPQPPVPERQPEPAPAQPTSRPAPDPKPLPSAERPAAPPSKPGPKKQRPKPQPRRVAPWLSNSLFVVNLALLIATFAAGWHMYFAWDRPTELLPQPRSLDSVLAVDKLDDLDGTALGQGRTPAAMLKNQIVVSFKAGVTPQQIGEVGREVGLNLVPKYEGAPHLTVATINPADRQALLDRLNGHPLVQVAEPDWILFIQWVPNDPGYAGQWNLQVIGMESAWERSKGAGSVVAVLDTGVMIQRGARSLMLEDLAQTASTNGYDFVDKDSEPEDFHGHGSHVAGTIAQSTDNGIGVAGVAPQATIMPVKVMTPRGTGANSDVAAGIYYAADKGAHVINMSLGFSVHSKILEDAVAYAIQKGVTVVCAAGNSGTDDVEYPAGFRGVIAVSATDRNGNVTGYSTYGLHLTLAAPGGVTDIISQGGLLPRLDYLKDIAQGKRTGIMQQTVEYDRNTGLQQVYRSMQGTSMASPHVAGAAALLHSLGVTNPVDIRSLLRQSAIRRDPPDKYGAGILDVAAAVQLVSKKNQIGGWNTNAGLVLVGAAVLWFLVRLGQNGVLTSFLPEAVGLALGIVLPDYLSKSLGLTSYYNLAAHSVVVPALLVLLLGEVPLLARFFSAMAVGVGITLTIAFKTQTSFLPVFDPIRNQYWFMANALFALFILVNYWVHARQWRAPA